MPSSTITTSVDNGVACGLELGNIGAIAAAAVIRYREAVFMRTFAINSPADRTLLTALYYCQEALACLQDGSPSSARPSPSSALPIKVPGEAGFPGLDTGTELEFSVEEKEQAREFLTALRDAVFQELGKAVNASADVKRWWMSLQRRRFINRQL